MVQDIYYNKVHPKLEGYSNPYLTVIEYTTVDDSEIDEINQLCNYEGYQYIFHENGVITVIIPHAGEDEFLDLNLICCYNNYIKSFKIKSNNVFSINTCFDGCTYLTNLTIDTPNLREMYNTCRDNDSIKKINLNTPKLNILNDSFINCYMLSYLDLSSIYAISDISNVCNSCILKRIILPNITEKKSDHLMFNSCFQNNSKYIRFYCQHDMFEFYQWLFSSGVVYGTVKEI